MKKIHILSGAVVALAVAGAYVGTVAFTFDKRIEATLRDIDDDLSAKRPNVLAAFAEFDRCTDGTLTPKGKADLTRNGCKVLVAQQQQDNSDELMELFTKRDQAIAHARATIECPWPFQ